MEKIISNPRHFGSFMNISSPSPQNDGVRPSLMGSDLIYRYGRGMVVVWVESSLVVFSYITSKGHIDNVPRWHLPGLIGHRVIFRPPKPRPWRRSLRAADPILFAGGILGTSGWMVGWCWLSGSNGSFNFNPPRCAWNCWDLSLPAVTYSYLFGGPKKSCFRSRMEFDQNYTVTDFRIWGFFVNHLLRMRFPEIPNLFMPVVLPSPSAMKRQRCG